MSQTKYMLKFYVLSTFFIFIFSAHLNSLDLDFKKYVNFALYDYNNKLHNLTDFTTSKAIVIMFISTQCPVSNDYNSRMAKIYSDYKDKNISFLGINSNKQESINEIKNHAKQNNLEFIILKDSNNVIADIFAASFTPEIFVLNNNFEQLYHGRIDDSRKIENVEINDLTNALDEILSGKDVKVKNTKAFGCSIKRVEK